METAHIARHRARAAPQRLTGGEEAYSHSMVAGGFDETS